MYPLWRGSPMLISAFFSFIVAFMPNHVSPFLISIGVFSTYFIISGYRSLRFKNKDVDLKTDRIIAYLIILTGGVMIFYPMVFSGVINIVLSIFGVLAIISGLNDLRSFNNMDKLHANWLKMHLGKMSGGYIAAVSAFFVVNQILPGVWNWFVPTIIGSVFIAYWIRKINKRMISSSK